MSKTKVAADPMSKIAQLLEAQQLMLAALNSRLDKIESGNKRAKATKMQASEPDSAVSADLKTACTWLIKHSPVFKDADGVKSEVFGGCTYFRLYEGKTPLGLKNRRLWGSGKSSDWGTVALKGDIIPL